MNVSFTGSYWKLTSTATQCLLFRHSKQSFEAYLSNAPQTSPLELLINVMRARHAIEHCLQEAKSELGLADDEVRFFHPWLKYLTLCFLAHCFLVLCRQLQGQKTRYRFSLALV